MKNLCIFLIIFYSVISHNTFVSLESKSHLSAIYAVQLSGLEHSYLPSDKRVREHCTQREGKEEKKKCY